MERLFGGALLAEIAGTIAGFGSSSIFLPIALQFFTYHNALVLVAIYHIFGNISRFSLFWKHRDKKIFFLFGIPSVVTTVCGAMIAGMVNPALLKIILGIVLIIFALYSLSKKVVFRTIKPIRGRLGGALSGFTAGLIGTGGVLRGAFMSSFGLSKESYVATIASVALLVDFTRIPVYFEQGFLNPSHIRMIPILLCIAFFGSWIGKRLIKKMHTTVLRKIILGAIIIGSVLLIVQGYTSLNI